MSTEKHKTSIGGSAVIEGVMMRGPDKMAIAVRLANGEVVVEEKKVSSDKNSWRKIPVIRGMVGFVDSMVLSMQSLMFSADHFDLEDETEPSKFDKWLEEKLGDKLKGVVIGFSIVISLAFSIGLFMLLPMLLAEGLDKLAPINSTVRSLTEGVARIAIFILYLVIVSRLKDIRRIFAYHGAEHKTICAYEEGLELTVENCRVQSRLHPRCGTSFLLFVMIISIILFSFVQLSFGWQRTVIKLLLLPLVAGLSYEVIKWAGRSDNPFVQWLSKPGLWLQLLTTCEPDEAQLEVAIASMRAVIPEKKEDAAW